MYSIRQFTVAQMDLIWTGLWIMVAISTLQILQRQLTQQAV